MRPQNSVTERQSSLVYFKESLRLEKTTLLWSVAILVFANNINYFLNPSYRNIVGLPKNWFVEFTTSLTSFVVAYFAVKTVVPKQVMSKINNTPSIWTKVFLGSAILITGIYAVRFLTGGL